MNIQQTLQKWGNGTGVRLPQKVVKAAHLQLNQPLDIDIKNGSIILTPVKDTPSLTLPQMLAGVEPKDIGGELDWGGAVGNEYL